MRNCAAGARKNQTAGEQSIAGDPAASLGAPEGAAAPRSRGEHPPEGLCWLFCGRILQLPSTAAAALGRCRDTGLPLLQRAPTSTQGPQLMALYAVIQSHFKSQNVATS